ncbi:hypothetical protein [Kribbella sp. NPDC051620]|uniref:hypothetical protein n=1 Tax=Kribbella sp. NPDC051620 TaxID=3364120 RepID=UPI003787C672
MADWSLAIGETLSRDDRVRLYGGGRYGGIEPSAKTPNVFIYSDPSKGERFGYNYDGWVDEADLFLYTGEGARRDQQFREGNLAIRDHVKRGRQLRVFVADGTVAGKSEKVQRYVGEFSLDEKLPYVRAEAPDIDGVMRSVIVFRLRQVGEVFRRPSDSSKYPDVRQTPYVETEHLPVGVPDLVVESVAIEAINSTEFAVAAKAAGVAKRLEAELVHRFKRYLIGQGHEVGSYLIKPPEELRSLRADLVDLTENILYEAKASSTRESIRMAVGQLLDYSRHVPDVKGLAVLLPSEPSRDLVSLLKMHGIRCVCEVNATFLDVAAMS